MSTTSNHPNINNNADNSLLSTFDCNICYTTAKNAVITDCGHLYCWPCIFRWLNTNRATLTCPVCKNGISQQNLIPVYTNDSDSQD